MLLLWSLALGKISVAVSCGYRRRPSTNVCVLVEISLNTHFYYFPHFSLNVNIKSANYSAFKMNKMSVHCLVNMSMLGICLSVISLFRSVNQIWLSAQVDSLPGESFPLVYVKLFFSQLKPPACKQSPHPTVLHLPLILYPQSSILALATHPCTSLHSPPARLSYSHNPCALNPQPVTS